MFSVLSVLCECLTYVLIVFFFSVIFTNRDRQPWTIENEQITKLPIPKFQNRGLQCET